MSRPFTSCQGHVTFPLARITSVYQVECNVWLCEAALAVGEKRAASRAMARPLVVLDDRCLTLCCAGAAGPVVGWERMPAGSNICRLQGGYQASRQQAG